MVMSGDELPISPRFLFHRCYILAALLLIHLNNFNANAQSVGRVYSAGQRLLEVVAPDSLAFADVDIGQVNIPLTHATRDKQTGQFPTKFMGYQVLISGRLMQITSIQDTPTPFAESLENLNFTNGRLRIGIYIPPDTPLSGEVEFGEPGAKVEIRKDDAQGAAQAIGIGQTTVLNTSPQLFVFDGWVTGGLAISMNEVSGVVGQLENVNRPFEFYHDVETPDLTTGQLQPTRVIMFGTGFRNALNSDLSNDPAGFKNVAEAYQCRSEFTPRDGTQLVKEVPIEYIGPVKDGMPGVDQIVIRLIPEFKTSSQPFIMLFEDRTGRSTNVINSSTIRATIPVK